MDLDDVRNDLSFGRVDAESEPDLDRRFLRTNDFERFLTDDCRLVLGAKGSGKSALFELFAKHEAAARQLAGPQRLQRVVIGTATGFGDVSEITGSDIRTFMSDPGFHFESLWKLYIAVKAALAMAAFGLQSTGVLADFLRAIGKRRDVRIVPLLRDFWGVIGGNPPSSISVNVAGTGVAVGAGGATQLDLAAILSDIQTSLQRQDLRLWLLFDKLDEILSSEPEKRTLAISELFMATRFMTRFPAIQPRILLRKDIWSGLGFPNKDHWLDKQLTLEWDRDKLRTLMIRRACVSSSVRAFIEERVPGAKGRPVDALGLEEQTDVFYALFERQAYGGPREAPLLTWMVERTADGGGTAQPRELILFGNLALQEELAGLSRSSTALISGRSVRNVFSKVSQGRVQTYLREFPSLSEHLDRFAGLKKAEFGRDELIKLMEGLQPSGLAMLRSLHEVGVISPIGRPSVDTAEQFAIPRLYRSGLGLLIRGRP